MGLKDILKKSIISALPVGIKDSIISERPETEFCNLSFSQEGEDLVLSRLFGLKSNGFYVDIGAHHPFRFSNTFKFYRSGWTGINLDPRPGSMDLFNTYRPNDFNLELAVSNISGQEIMYYMFDEPALNSFSEESALHIENTTQYKIINKIKIKTFTLKEILDKYLPKTSVIDFFTIDVEGWDLNVLISNDWDKYKPLYIIAESRSTHLSEDITSDMSNFLKQKGYELTGKLVNSLIYKKIN